MSGVNYKCTRTGDDERAAGVFAHTNDLTLGGLSSVSLLHQAADSDDDNDPLPFMGPTGEFNLTTHPEDEGAELHGVNITTYGEVNLIAEPQKVKPRVR